MEGTITPTRIEFDRGALSIVLHDGRRFEICARPPSSPRGDIEVVLVARDGSSAGQAWIHLDDPARAEVTLAVRPGPAADEAGAVLLAEAAELAARCGAVELLAPHFPGDPHATSVLDGVGLAHHEIADHDERVALIDLRPLQSWRAMADLAT